MSKGRLFKEGFPFNFPAGEVQVRVALGTLFTEGFRDHDVVTFMKKVRNSDDIMEILLTADALRRAGYRRLRLVLPYVPYSRQDRVMVEGESLAIKVFADLLNSVGFEEVEIWDPHSDVTTALINNVRVVTQEELVFNLMRDVRYDLGNIKDLILVCPDAGARKKVLKVASTLGIKDIVYADKVRNVSTGQITGTTVDFSSTKVSLRKEGFKESFLIVDDIGEGCRTFIELAKVLRDGFKDEEKPSLYLYVTHGFFSKGMDELAEYFQGIYVANMMSQDPKVLEHPVLKTK